MIHGKFAAYTLATLVLGLTPAAVAQAQDAGVIPGELLDGLPWRQIGPASFGGRIDDIEAVRSNPDIIFVATASGGIFKSVNHGVTWRPVFDEEGVSLSIGDIAIAPSDPNIVWAGTGEANNRQSSSWGHGVYKSLDGGETWLDMGLTETHHIGRVVIHPTNPDIVFVAALGHLWGPNPERGLYRTKDGGKNWERVLTINEDTGVVDIAMDADGRTLFAAAYQRRRRAWGFVGGGPHGGLYRSVDGGGTWEKLDKGLPSGDIGRIGLDISRSHPDIVYAMIENKNEGGVYRSDDRGATWTKMNSLNNRPMYYSQIRVDPKNPNRVWSLGSPLFVSEDGGKTFTSEGTGEKIHVDHHALWIDPDHPDHLLLGNDGGLYFTYDAGKSWDFIDNLPIGQYYDVAMDGRDPYWIYGGTQDNGFWGIPSRTYSQLGIMNSDVVNIAYGDGFYGAVDPRDYHIIFAESQSGRTYRVDLDTREEKGIRPVPEDPEEEYRFNWSSPMTISLHPPHALYYGGNKVFKTTDGGQRWEVVSPDLTRNQEWKKLPIMGVERNDDTLSRDDGVSDYGTITSIAESPRQAGLLYVGTDDGNVQMTRDDGKTWVDLSSKFGLPGPRWVSRVFASHHDAGTAYVAFDGHQDDDFTPYLFKTTDFGDHWSSVAGDIPDGSVLNAFDEHPHNPNLLFAGTELGLYVSVNGGRNWSLMHGSLPRVPVDDIAINPGNHDLVLGTHGRSIILLDDISMLENMGSSVLTSEAHLFPVRPAVQFYEQRMLPVPGAAEFSGPNPDYGALITYYLRDDPPPSEMKEGEEQGEGEAKSPVRVRITISDKDGNPVRDLEAPDTKGLHRVAWDLRYPLPFEPDDEEGWFGPPRGPFVLPGEYTLKLSARGKELVETVEVRVDPQARTDAEALRARLDANRSVVELQRVFVEAGQTIDNMQRELDRIKKLLEEQENVPEELTKRVEEVTQQLDASKEDFKAGWGGPKFRIFDLADQLQASTSAPTEAQMRSIEHLTKEMSEKAERLNELLTTSFPELQDALSQSGIRPVLGKPLELEKK